MADADAISAYLQRRLCETGASVTAVGAASWLDRIGLLADSKSRFRQTIT